MTRSVTVVVPTYNRIDRLRRVLDALSTQTYPADYLELVVVSDGSSDGTEAYLAERTMPFDFVVAQQENAGPAAARNRGTKLASGDIVLFVDDDVVAAPDLVARHASHHDDNRQVVIGPMLTPDGFAMSPWVRWEQAMLYRQYEAMARGDYRPTYRQFYTGNASLPRASILDLGGFDTTYRRAEDVELSYRLSRTGHRFVFDPHAVGLHYAERPFRSWLQMARDYGANDVAFAHDHGRGDILEIVRNEFPRRNPLVRWTALVCAGSDVRESGATAVLRATMALASRMQLDRVTASALSGLYNLAYYGGMAGALGGRRAFHAAVKGAAA
jgi:GT2 family glycosyltransferase